MIKIINIGKDELRGICVLNEQYIFIGSKDKTIKLIDINKGEIVISKEGHNNSVLTMKIINVDKIGSCLISQGYEEDHIKIWEIKNN